jgi:phage shock protein A
VTDARQAEKEYALSLLTQIKLNEKLAAEYEAEAGKWEKRAAGTAADRALAAEAEARAAEVRNKAAALKAENAELRTQAEQAIRSVPAMAERSVDPDLLLQELLVAAGHDPGSEEERDRERKFAEMEKNAAADAALAELKAKMAGVPDN